MNAACRTIPQVLALSLLVLASCAAPQTSPAVPPASPTNSAPSASTPSAAAPLPVQHQIGIRTVDGAGQFYDRLSGQPFVPRGMNYGRLAWQTTTDGGRIFGHALFDPGAYDPARVHGDLKRMHDDGYNVVRVFLSPETSGTATGGLSAEYLRNVADFLSAAAAEQLYVMITLDWIPAGKYASLLNAECCTTFALMNANLLPAAGLRANQVFYQDFINGLREQGAPLEIIFSYELRNELYYDGDQPPLSLTSGTVTTANGQSYDMSSTADKQRMLDENLVYWIDAMRGAILDVDPGALVSVGFFQPSGPNPARLGDARISITRPAIWDSQADFIDLHAYPGQELSLKQYVENFGMEGQQARPIIMGEFGGQVKSFASVETAAQRFVRWQAESCRYGFDGWLFWTWDLDEQPDFFNARMGDGQIEKALAPVTRPDPCVETANGGAARDLALNAAAQASRSLPDQPAANAVDGAVETLWNAGGSPPQWIEIELAQPATITVIRLTVAQSPAGHTLHQIWVAASGGTLRLVHEFSGTTADGDVLEFRPETPLEGLRRVRVLTAQGPSWVAWRQIEIIGGGE